MNFYTGGTGSEHPFFDHYQIMSYPTLILIDKKGRLASTAVPDPRGGNFEKMMQKIEALL